MKETRIESVMIALRQVIRATDIHSRSLIKTTGLTTPQILLLQILMNKGDLSVGTLAREMNLSQATVTTVLDRLAGRGYITRNKSDRDKRMVKVSITEQGRAIAKDSPVPLQEHFVTRFRALEDWEQSMIITSLQKVAWMMGTEGLPYQENPQPAQDETDELPADLPE